MSMKFFLQTNVDILTFMSGKNSIIGLSEQKKKLNILIFYTFEDLRFYELSMKKVLLPGDLHFLQD